MLKVDSKSVVLLHGHFMISGLTLLSFAAFCFGGEKAAIFFYHGANMK